MIAPTIPRRFAGIQAVWILVAFVVVHRPIVSRSEDAVNCLG